MLPTMAALLALTLYPTVLEGRNAAGFSTIQAEQSRPPAPEFALTTLKGQKLDLASYRGKVVLLDFWATWCVPCRSEIPHFVRLQNAYRARGLQIIGISLDDDVAPVRRFYRQFKMNYPVALGDAELAGRYGGILGLPVSFLIDRDGRIVSTHKGAKDIVALEREITALLSQ